MTDPMRPIDMTCDEVRELAGAFVLGALEPAEAAAVRAHLASCADPHAEIAEVGSVLPVLDASVPLVEPPPALKGRIMAAAAADLEARQRGGGLPPVGEGATPAASPAPAPTATTEVTPFPSADERNARAARKTSPATWAVRIAAVLVIGLLGGWNLLLQGQLSAAQTYEDNVAAVLEVASQPGALHGRPRADDQRRSARARRHESDGDMAMAMRDLAPTTGSEVYEAWVIGSDGVPVPLGGFPVGSSGIGVLHGDGPVR